MIGTASGASVAAGSSSGRARATFSSAKARRRAASGVVHADDVYLIDVDMGAADRRRVNGQTEDFRQLREGLEPIHDLEL
jgi:hypothetical protein